MAWLLAGVAVALCYVAVTLGHGSDAAYARLLRNCRTGRAQPYLSCVNASVLQYIYQHPRAAGAVLADVSAHGRDGEPSVDLRWLSATAHYAGMELSALPLTLHQALGDCGYAFKAACMHGFVMERLDRDRGHGRALISSFLGYCRAVENDRGPDENCLHAVGHELWARTYLTLSGTLEQCDPLRRAAERSACWSGVLMEYSEGATTKGRHSHTPAGKRALPCAALPARFREVCTYAEASYRQYVPGWELPRTTYERCQAAAPAYRLGCMTLVSERLLIAHAGSPRLADDACAQLRSGRALCNRSIARLHES